MTRIALALVLCSAGCARLDGDGPADAGLVDLPRVADVQPPEGAVEAGAVFRVSFTAAMDEGTLVASTGRSESIALVPETVADRAAAAVEHSRLTVEERGLLVATTPAIEGEGSGLTLTPDAPLAPGTYYLLVAARLRDPAGHRLAEASRYRYTVAAGSGARLALVSPLPGSSAPANLARVRVSVDSGAGTLSLVGPKGVVASAVLGPKGPLELPLCRASAKTCAPLEPGQTYSLALDGKRIEGSSFAIARCARLFPPQGAFRASVRDTSVIAEVDLDWPARIALRSECADGKCPEGFAETTCAPDPCAPPVAAACKATVHLEGLAPATEYSIHIDLDDDEGHATVSGSQRVTTLSPLPTVVISEVMASPPGAAPRSDGEYVELWNNGRAPVDLSGLTLTGPDGTPRHIIGSLPPEPVALAAGARALAVGASFDPLRYSLPPGTLVLRASTQRLLGRGLSDASPPPILLSTEDGVTLSLFPGSTTSCPSGTSFELAGGSDWNCGEAGGSPGGSP
ncbi:MAG: hypothetical protein ACJ78T_15260 [Myxococcales bacterium]